MRWFDTVPRTLRAAVAGLALVVAVIPAASAELFNPKTFTLDNGMEVVLVEMHRAPVVAHMVWYRVGAMDEPLGKSGMAHLLEHLMFKGTDTVPEGQFSQMVAAAGGRENAFTSSDYTGYFQTIARDRLEMVMRLEADRMHNLSFTVDELRTEREVVLEERRTRTDNRPESLFGEQFDGAFYYNHPYGRPIIGWEYEIRNITMEDLVSFYETWYVPNNAILVVAGDVTVDELRPLAEKYYGSIPRSVPAPRPQLKEPPQLAERRIVMCDERVRQPSLQRAYLAPSYMTGDSKHAEALDVMAGILGGDSTSRLYRRLVVEQRLAVSAGAWYGPTARGPAQFGVYASPRPGTSMEDLEAAVDKELQLLMREGVSPEEVERQKKRIIADSVYARDSLMQGARILGAALATGLSVQHVESWPDRIAAVTAEDVEAAAREVLEDPAFHLCDAVRGLPALGEVLR